MKKVPLGTETPRKGRHGGTPWVGASFYVQDFSGTFWLPTRADRLLLPKLVLNGS